MSAWGGRRTVELLTLVLHTYGARCHLCLLPITGARGTAEGPSTDHVVPRKHGGTDELDNLRPAHKRCNSRRRDELLTPELLASFRRHRMAESGRPFFRV